MGGGAFSQAYAEGEPTLNTPRMSPGTYDQIKSISLKKLQDYFPRGKVLPLIEAPEKASHGDVDFFVAVEQQVDFVDLANHLGATGVLCHDPKKAAFAVARDGTASERPCILYKHDHGVKKTKPSHRITAEEYAQLDVEVVSPASLEWHAFYSSYSDLAGLIGHIITQLGFTVSDRGLWLRLREIDFSKTVDYVNIADREGMILLSSDPKKVIQFLGCSVEDYEAGFTTLEQLYRWVGACRLLSPEALKIKRDNSHERNREQKRTIYSGFFNEWLPAHFRTPSEQDEEHRTERVHHLRKQYLEEALEFFSKHDEYETKHNSLVLAINNGLAASLLKPLIAEHSGRKDKSLNEILKAFRRHFGCDDQNKPKILRTPHTDADSELHKLLNEDQTALKDPRMVSEWVETNWEELRALERQRGKAGGVTDF